MTNAIYQTVPKEDIAVFLVSDEDEAMIRSFIKAGEYTLPVFVEEGPPPALLSAPEIPITYIIAPNGAIIVQHRGAANWNDETVHVFLRKLVVKD